MVVHLQNAKWPRRVWNESGFRNIRFEDQSRVPVEWDDFLAHGAYCMVRGCADAGRAMTNPIDLTPYAYILFGYILGSISMLLAVGMRHGMKDFLLGFRSIRMIRRFAFGVITKNWSVFCRHCGGYQWDMTGCPDIDCRGKR